MAMVYRLSVSAVAAVVVAEVAAGGSGNCPTGPYCLSNHSAVVHSGTISSTSECCDLCTKNFKCVAWTAWTDPKGELLCNQFGGDKAALQNASGGTGCTAGLSGVKPKRPNFIFVFPDTLRAESFAGYGSLPESLNVTPRLREFAKTGTRFEQAHVMHTQCSPSRCTMLTGRYMHVLGHRTQTHLIEDYEVNYFRVLKEMGYHIEFIGKNDAFSPASFNLSISHWENVLGYPSGGNAYDYNESGYFSFLSTGANVSGTDANVSNDLKAHMLGVDFLQNAPPEPFVLFVPTRGAHPPYGAPREWHDRYSVEQLKAAGVQLRPRNIPGMPTYMSATDGIPKFRNLTALTGDELMKIQAVYLGMISYTDYIFGQLLDGLAAAPDGLADRTAVFFSSDHGDFGGDYGLVEKWPGSMADVLTRVPLYARIPGGAAGHVATAPVQTADILETMLDLSFANVTQAEWVRFGQSLAPALRGGDGDPSRFVYSEGGFYFENEQMMEAGECLGSCPYGLYCPRGQEEAQPNGSPRAVMVRNGTAKLVHRPTGVSELYDLVQDPRETKNLFDSPEAAALRTDLLQHLVDWMVLTGDVTPGWIDSRGGPKYPYDLPPGDPWSHVTDFLAINGVTEH